MNRQEMHKRIDAGEALIPCEFLSYKIERKEKRDKVSKAVIGVTIIARTNILIGDTSFTRDEFLPDGTKPENITPPPFKRHQQVVARLDMFDAKGEYGSAWKGELFPLEG